MKIGLTFDLRDVYLAEGYSEAETAEFDQVATVDAIDAEIRSWGYETERIGRVTELAARLVAGDRWDLVFNIAEGFHGIGREAQVPALLDAYNIPYTFSDPLVMALSLHKAMTKRVIRQFGIPTPDFAVIEQIGELERVALPYPVFAKPVAEGTGKGITAGSKITGRPALRARCAELLNTFHQPVLIETFLPGREFTVGVVGTGRAARSIGMMEIILNKNADRDVYTYANKEWWEDRVIYQRADDETARFAAEVALQSYVCLDCRDSGRVDIRVDDSGVPNFLEINPLAGLHPTHSDLPILCTLNGVSYHELIGEILTSAIARNELRQPQLRPAATLVPTKSDNQSDQGVWLQ